MDESPPVTLCFSSTTTLAPAREASTAALMPATPLPTMTKSTSLVSCFSAGVSAAAWMVSGFWAPVALDVLLALAASEPLSALAGAAVLCGAQPARPLPATTAAVAPSPIRNERRETPADAMFFPSVLMMILPVRRCFLSAADPPPVDPLSPSCQGTGSPRQRQSGWIAKTLHSGGVEGGGTKAGREAERCCTPCLPERSAVRRGVEGSRAVPTGSAAAAAARDPSTPRLAGLPALASRAREFDSLLACRMLRSLRTTAGVPPRGARRGRGGLACRRRCSSGTRCGCSP